MARTRRRSEASVSLFPFLSVLACVMGTLTLIIYGVALGGALEGSSAEAYQETIDRIAQISTEIEELEDAISLSLERERQVCELTEQVTQMQAELPYSFEETKRIVALLSQYEELKEQILSLEDELARSAVQFQDLKDQITTIEGEDDSAVPSRPAGLVQSQGLRNQVAAIDKECNRLVPDTWDGIRTMVAPILYDRTASAVSADSSAGRYTKGAATC